MRELPYDLRDTWRGLRRDRLYAAAVIGTLALTLGAAVTVFSIVDGILLRPLHYPRPQELVSIREVLPAVVDRYPSLPVTMRHFDVWRDRAQSFSAMAATDWRTSTLTRTGDAVQIVVLRTSGTLFDVLGIPLAMGRGFTRDDEHQDRPRVTVISDRLWRERLNSDPAILGRPLTLNGVEHTIVGVLPRAYALPRLEPLGESGTITADLNAIVPFRINLANFDWMGSFNYGVVARLKPGTDIEQARSEMAVLQATVAEIAKRETKEATELRAWMKPLGEAITGPARRSLLLLATAVLSLLLIACANLANLTLTRAIARLREAAVRGALGASRWRLVRASILDQIVLGVCGGALGLVVAAAAIRVFITTAPLSLPRVADVALDARVITAAWVMTCATALVVAILPAWRVGRGNLEQILRSGGRGSDGGSNRVRSILLVAQVALSVMLLAVAGLFLSSLSRLLAVDTGFDAARSLTVEVAPGSSRYPDTPQRAALYDRILEQVRTAPGVAAASFTSALPLTGETWVDKAMRLDSSDRERFSASANFRFVGPDYFAAIGMPLVRGREIDGRERTSALTPAVISQRAARTLWPGEDAIGREFSRADPSQRFQVVGIAPDGRTTTLDADPPLMVYVPYWFNNEGRSILIVRTRATDSQLAARMREIVRNIDPDVPIARIAPLEQVVDTAVEGRRYQATLLGTFAASALLIAMLGVYATTAYGVSRRQRELNIRAALGAHTRQIVTLVLRQSLAAIAVGLACGGVAAVLVGGTLSGLLYEVAPRDPLVLGMVLATVATAGAIAALVATFGSLRLDPAMALRQDEP